MMAVDEEGQAVDQCILGVPQVRAIAPPHVCARPCTRLHDTTWSLVQPSSQSRVTNGHQQANGPAVVPMYSRQEGLVRETLQRTLTSDRSD
ncbi:hypothetical protein F2P81_013276 [Scophthalmus maximus]|uniref:Uncharacterized protein n=1 Tax=Scophthalmus maximus TaxID=52904 RepID=A0A6A4STT6_SCOMX|nr:hypothetical protein F2P81_013276 [Scophthalmus maximus]